MKHPGKAGFSILLVAAVMGAGIYTAFHVHRIYREKELEIERLTEVVGRLTAETRIAQVLVTDHARSPETGLRETTIKFVELDRQGKPLKPRFFTVDGDVIYFDSLVIKFDHEYVEQGEALRGKSVSLFRRIFSERQKPEDGFPMDDSGEGVPDIYRVDPTPSPFEVDLWKNFWRYATDPEEARRLGVRVIQGEAVYQRFIKGNLYTLSLDHDGGLNINVEPIPSILMDEMSEPD